jgi:hypothetical protein
MAKKDEDEFSVGKSSMAGNKIYLKSEDGKVGNALRGNIP